MPTSNMSRKCLCILFCVLNDLIVTNGAKLPTIDIQGSLQKDSSTSRQPKFLFGVSKYLYSLDFRFIDIKTYYNLSNIQYDNLYESKIHFNRVQQLLQQHFQHQPFVIHLIMQLQLVIEKSALFMTSLLKVCLVIEKEIKKQKYKNSTDKYKNRYDINE